MFSFSIGRQTALFPDKNPSYFQLLSVEGKQLSVTVLSIKVLCFLAAQIEPSSIVSIRSSIVQAMANRLCNSCDITPSVVQNDTLLCDRTALDYAVYHGRVVGTGRLSSRSMLTFLEDWVLSNTASVTVDNGLYALDFTCPAQLDSPEAPACSVEPTTVPPTTVSTSTTTAATTATTTTTASPGETDNVVFIEREGSRISSGEVGGLVIGVVIIILLAVFVVLLVVLLLRSFICPPSKVR